MQTERPINKKNNMRALPPRNVVRTSHRTNNPKQGKQKKLKKKRSVWRIFRIVAAIFLLVGSLGAGWLFLTPSGTEMRFLIADTLITTQHRHWAKYIIGQAELDKRVQEYWARFERMGDEKSTIDINKPSVAEQAKKPLVEYKEVSGTGATGASFSGYLMIVNDPTKIRIGVPGKVGRGEKVSSMVKRTGALAGVNGGGFADPNWEGNGFKPIGVVINDGKMYYNGVGKQNTQIVGIDKDGKMVAGNFKVSELLEMGVKEAVTFQPRMIVNGKGQIRNHADGWGIAPRTVMGQRKDGAILFLVIDGRQPHSIGADLYDCQKIMLENGAVIAANLDGGSSTVLVEKDGVIKNSPSSQYGERYLPTAFLVFEHPEDANIPNIWEGMRPSDIDPSKW
ncbi:phosphodiester glycosidase family protein [Paenibacillus alvei]|uniref:Phosphodiester glycosidase family protein n=2 Tax=Paenibacillus TaxID=44249 RepID=A0ABT4H5Q4_PAEAL|nr:phosphodiester glycosidase family protein [Paenibacillus alvei]MCY9540595.1 phosphodiester glycosidase family protein [Paenibacillus alvei]MCY9736034.1 phosphodiester glycosidase family protein [Paenibacillus alvei]MCY9764083.1 phosphodiester glycosidase family protein [Paenibacillus alvei]MCY9765541.1 phosphodiester glycosidase family protein [Paenibacillus alvei]MEC0082321.1 phosphodiester glycosidase family protein [Paenibacillus alvei]